MKAQTLIGASFVVALASVAWAGEPKSTSGDGFGNIIVSNVHGDVTVAALKNYLSRDCLEAVIDEDVKQDHGAADKLPTNHFDDNLICASWQIVQERKAALATESTRAGQVHRLGEILHGLQDFYSHANYVELFIDANPDAGLDDIPLFDFDTYCSPRRGTYAFEKVVTGTYQGNHGFLRMRLSEEDLSNPYSHLHLNKDFSPHKNRQLAKVYSRSALLRSKGGKGERYFDFVSSLQIRETEQVYKAAAASVVGLDKTCRLK